MLRFLSILLLPFVICTGCKMCASYNDDCFSPVAGSASGSYGRSGSSFGYGGTTYSGYNATAVPQAVPGATIENATTSVQSAPRIQTYQQQTPPVPRTSIESAQVVPAIPMSANFSPEQLRQEHADATNIRILSVRDSNAVR